MTKYCYLFHLQYLGYRYHGWLKQPGLKTVEFMMEKTAAFLFGAGTFTIVGSSRTDAKVSAHHGACELIVDTPYSEKVLQDDFNKNLPNDIRVKKVEQVDEKFNIITNPRSKTYRYFFSFGEKPHPFCAPLICSFPYDLDIDLMMEGARLFEGTHDFRQYCTTPRPGTVFGRNIEKSFIEENTLFTANFFPQKSYVYTIEAKGFMRHQIRLIMGQLLRLGRGEIGVEAIRKTLIGSEQAPLRHIAPSSGLMLYDIRFEM